MASGFKAILCQMVWPRKGGPCPQCGEHITPPAPVREKPWETVIRCPCGWAGSYFHLLENHKGPPRLPADEAVLEVSPPLPSGSRIQHAGGVEETWSLPRSGSSGCLLPFGIVWLGMSSLLSFSLWTSSSHPDGVGAQLMGRLIFGVGFPLIGVVIAGIGLRMKYARHWISLDGERLTLERELFGRRKRKSLRRAGITRVALREFYSRNYQPVYGVEVRGRDGKLRFGSGLKDDEKAWLEHDLRRALGLLTVAGALPADGAARAHSPALEVERAGRTVTLRLTPKKSDLAGGGLFMMIFAAAFCGISQVAMSSDESGGAFLLLGRIIFVVAPLLVFLIGFLVWREGRPLSGTVTVLHANDSWLTLELKRRRDTTQEQWRRAEVERVQTGVSGGKNGRPIMHGEIVTADRVILFGMGSEPDDLEVMCAELRSALGLEG